ncbi:hypothetical protein BX666DRAFT_1963939 [Dichotomocladium elegans]|nr:hypothetical protein BX666DRAFT_1963939 [Dichotomocladium elegans]
MLDLDSFYRSPNESWADMMDEEDENLVSDNHGGPDAKAKTKPNSSDAGITKTQELEKKHTTSTLTIAASFSEATGARRKPETELKKSNDGGIVWRIPSAKEREQQKAAMESLIEQRRQNIDKLDSWRRNDDDRPKLVASDLATSWRRPIHKYEHIPVRPSEVNNVQGWASYSETLQKEYNEECEAAKQEFIRRFGSATTERANEMANHTPSESLVAVDDPSDGPDDISRGDGEQQDHEASEENNEGSMAEEGLPRDFDSKISLENVNDSKDGQDTMEQLELVDQQRQGEEEQAVATVVSEVTEETVVEIPPMTTSVEQEKNAMRWNNDTSLSSNNDGITSRDTSGEKKAAEVANKPSERSPSQLQDASSRWMSFALEETRRNYGLSRSPGNQATSTSSSISSIESKGRTASQDFSDDSHSTQVLSHSSSTSTKTSIDVPQVRVQHQHQSPAPPLKVRSALSQITKHLLKNMPDKNPSSSPGRTRPHFTPASREQPGQKVENTASKEWDDHCRTQTSPSAREAPIVISQNSSATHHHESDESLRSPSTPALGWSQLSVSPRHSNRSERHSASPASGRSSSGWQSPNSRTHFQDRDRRTTSPSLEKTKEQANMSWQSFARNHSSQPYHRG